MRIEDLYAPDFPMHKAIDINGLEGVELGLFWKQVIPRRAMKDCSRLVVSLLLGRDIRVCLEAGAGVDGITEAIPFMTPLVWNALVNMDNWEFEKKNIETIMMYHLDSNQRGICGFNLLHFYMVECLCKGDSHKLIWWIGHPMVDVNSAFLRIHDSKIEALHPSEWIESICSQFPEKNRELLISVLVERGMSVAYLSKVSRQQLDMEIGRRRRIERHDGNRNEDISIETIREARRIYYASRGLREMPTPEMNELVEVPLHHCLEHNGFAFHGSYLEMIFKTHRLPFTGEEIPKEKIKEWIAVTGGSREECLLEEVEDYCQRRYEYTDRGDLLIEMIHDWLLVFFPYTRWLHLRGLSDKMYAYLSSEMNRGDFIFAAFCKEKNEEDTWKEFFVKASYDSIAEGFIFSNRIEELISRVELYKNIRDPEFHNIVSMRALMDSDRFYEIEPLMRSYLDEFDVTMFQVFYMLRKMSRFLSNG